jgi:hypothetical protein
MGNDTTWIVVRKASVWLCDNGKSEYTGYVKSISPLGFDAVLSARRTTDPGVPDIPAGQPLPDLGRSLMGRRFTAAICGRKASALVDAVATEVRKLTASSFDYSVTCRFRDLDNEQKKMVVCLIIEHYAPPSVAM